MSEKRGQKNETSKQAPSIWQCPSGIAQRPQHHAIAVPTTMQNRVTKTMSVVPPLGNNWSRRSPTLSLSPITTSLLLISSGLATSWESSSPPSSWSHLDSQWLLAKRPGSFIYNATVVTSASPFTELLNSLILSPPLPPDQIRPCFRITKCLKQES